MTDQQNKKKAYSKPDIATLGRLDRFINDQYITPFKFDGKITPITPSPMGFPQYRLLSMSTN